MSKTHYDTITREYQESKLLPFRRHVEEHTMFATLGDLAGAELLDLACGEGIYSRRLAARGARRVVGVDISPGMVELARSMGSGDAGAIEYRVGDALTLGRIGAFDIVLGSYLLNYARSKAELLQFCASIAANLKPGGRFVGFNDNPANDIARYPSYAKYGFVKIGRVPRTEGDPITYAFVNPDGRQFTLENYYLRPETYETAFAESGFRGLRWIAPTLSPEGRTAHAPGYWDDFLDHPPMIGLEASIP